MQFTFILFALATGCNSLSLSRNRRQSEPDIDVDTLPSVDTKEIYKGVTEKSIFIMDSVVSVEPKFQISDFSHRIEEKSSTDSKIEQLLSSDIVRNFIESDDSHEEIIGMSVTTITPEFAETFLSRFLEQRDKFQQENYKSKSENIIVEPKSILSEDLSDYYCTESNVQKINRFQKRENSERNYEKPAIRNESDYADVTEHPLSSIEHPLFTDAVVPIISSNQIYPKTSENKTEGENNKGVTLSSNGKGSAYPDLFSKVIPSDKNNAKRESSPSTSTQITSNDSKKFEPLPPLDPLDDEDGNFPESSNPDKTAPDDIENPGYLVKILSAMLSLYITLRRQSTEIYDIFAKIFS